MAQQAPQQSLPSSGGTLTGSLLFSPDGTPTIGALASGRPAAMYMASSDLSVSGMVVEVANASGPTGGAAINFEKARGSLASKLSISSADQLGNLNFYGYDGSAYGRGAAVITLATEAWDTSHHGARLAFRTAANGTTTTTERWYIDAAGHWAPTTNNTYDIGGAGDGVRSVYLGGYAALTATQSEAGTAQFVINNEAGTNVNGNGIRIGTNDANGLRLLWSANGTLNCDNGNGTAFCTMNAGDFTSSGNITSTSTGSIGWSVVAHANQACSTTCTSGCAGGQDTDAATKPIVDCSDVTADRCFCAGAN